MVDRAFWRQAGSSPLAVRGEVYVMLFGRRGVRLQLDGVTPVPGDGRCSVSLPLPNPAGWQGDCFAPFHRPFSQNETVQEMTAAGGCPFAGSSAFDLGFAASGRFRYGPDPRAYIRRSFSGANTRGRM